MSRDFSPKFYTTKEWFEKNPKGGFVSDILKIIDCNRSQFLGYCEKLVANGFLGKETRSIPDRRASGTFYYRMNETRPRDLRWDNPDLPPSLSLLSPEEIKKNCENGWQSEGRNKRASYGPSEAEVKRKREVQKLYKRLQEKKGTTKRKVVSLV